MEDWNLLAKQIGFADEKSMWEGFYVTEELPISEIARKLGHGPTTIANRLSACKIDKRARGGANNTVRISKILFRMDQREVFGRSNLTLSTMLLAHESTIYKYKRGVQR